MLTTGVPTAIASLSTVPNGSERDGRHEDVEVAHQPLGVVDPPVVLGVCGLAHLASVCGIGVVGVVADDDDPGVRGRGQDRGRREDEVERALARLDPADEADDRAVPGLPGRVAGGGSSSTGQ